MVETPTAIFPDFEPLTWATGAVAVAVAAAAAVAADDLCSGDTPDRLNQNIDRLQVGYRGLYTAGAQAVQAQAANAEPHPRRSSQG